MVDFIYLCHVYSFSGERIFVPLPVLGDGGGLGVAEEWEGAAEGVGLSDVFVSGGQTRP